MSTAHQGWAVGAGVPAAGIIAATTWSGGAHRAPVMEAADAPSPSATTSPTASASPAAATAATSTTTATIATAPAPPPLPAAQDSATRSEPAALATRLSAHVVLTAPAAWARDAGSSRSDSEDVTSCPGVATALGAELGHKLSRRMSRVRKRDNAPEMAVRRLLRAQGIGCRACLRVPVHGAGRSTSHPWAAPGRLPRRLLVARLSGARPRPEGHPEVGDGEAGL